MCFPESSYAMDGYTRGVAQSRGLNVSPYGQGAQPQQSSPQPQAQPQPQPQAQAAPAAAAQASATPAAPIAAATPAQPAATKSPLSVSKLGTGSVYSQAQGTAGVSAPAAIGSRNSVVQRG